MTGRAAPAREPKVPSGTIARPMTAHVKSDAEHALSTAAQSALIAAIPGTRDAEREADKVASKATAAEKERAATQKPRFDFSSVRIHANALSPSESRKANASAIAVGRDIYFAEGRFAPGTREGRSLLAHELVHVVQQTRSGVTLPQRKTPDEEIDEDLKKQVGSDTKSLDPDNEEYARTLQQLGFTLTHDQQNALLTKPTKPAEVAAWELRFKKAGILADRILKAGQRVTDKESRAGMLAQDLADAGFLDKAMEIAGKLSSAEQKDFIYKNVLKQPSGMSVAHATTITGFYAATAKTLADHPVAVALQDRSGDYGKALGDAKLNMVFKMLVIQYEKDPDIIEFMSHVLIFNASSRATLTATLNTLGKNDLLFQVLRGPYFADEDQPERKAFGINNSTTPKTLTDADQKWAVGEKQKILIDRVIALAAAQKITISKPANMQFATIRSWLDANTEKIGQALAAGSADAAAQMYRDMADTFFWHVPTGVDVAPDLQGKVAKLGEGDPQKSRLKSDCDVLASYAMRLLTNSGLTPVGYMAIKPPPGRDGHAMALMKKGTVYYAISNKTIEKLDPTKTAKLDDALVTLRDYGLDEAYATPHPPTYEVYWQVAGPTGVLDQKLVDADSSLERKDLEPSSP
jgi:hypothetical protein